MIPLAPSFPQRFSNAGAISKEFLGPCRNLRAVVFPIDGSNTVVSLLRLDERYDGVAFRASRTGVLPEVLGEGPIFEAGIRAVLIGPQQVLELKIHAE